METKAELPGVKEKGRKWVKPVIAVVIVGLLLILIVSRLGAGKTDSGTDQERLQPVAVASVMNRPISDELSFAGLITPFMEVNLSPKVMGRVSSVNVEVGQRVKQGETLLTIEQTDFYTGLRQAEASLESARANSIQAETNYENARINYHRHEQLFKQGAVSQGQLEAAKGQLAAAESGYRANQAMINQAEALLEKARSDFSNTVITAPFSGVVAKRMVDPGEMVSQQTPVITLIRDEPLLVRVNLPENVVTRVAVNQQVDIYVGATGKTYRGVVKTLAPQADQTTKAFAAEVRLDKVGQEVKPGMVAELRIKTRQVDNALVVPTDALLDQDSGFGVFVVENGIARYRKVTTGLVSQGHTQVVSGLKPGETVVVRGNHLLVDGMKVKVEGTPSAEPVQSGGDNI